MALGFQAAGCRIAAAVEIDEIAASTFRRNFGILQPLSPPHVWSGEEGNLDRTDLSWLGKPGSVDIIVGGPPCQGFSRVGRGKLDSLSPHGFANDPRNKLYCRFRDAVALLKPRAFVMENVTGMFSVAGRDVADEVARELANYGYRTVYTLLNAAWYGVPQLRQRVFFVGLRDDLEMTAQVPAVTHLVKLPTGYERRDAASLSLSFLRHFEIGPNLTKARIRATTARDALADLPLLTHHLSHARPPAADLPYASEPRSPYAVLMRSWPGLPRPEAVTQNAVHRTPRDYETFRRMRPGGRYDEALRVARNRLDEHIRNLDAGDLPSTLEGFCAMAARFVPPYPTVGFRDKWRKLTPNEPSWTVPAHLAKDAYSHIHYDDDQARAISVREAARLQAFPDAFTFEGNMGDCYRQIGNAVPPVLSWALAVQLLTDLGHPAKPIEWHQAAPAEPAQSDNRRR
jgi:DNA (cytosine-5)-methyltransferase 1